MNRKGESKVGAAVVLLTILIFAVVAIIFLGPNIFTPYINPGQPSQNPITKKYTIYVAVYGHRDRTPLHGSLHANIHVDSVSVHYAPPPSPPSGTGFWDLNKNIHVTLTAGSYVATFDVSVSLGEQWGKVVSFTLPSGTHSIIADGVDQDGYQSSASMQLHLE